METVSIIYENKTEKKKEVLFSFDRHHQHATPKRGA
jgi:hypothetical protein